jgi:DNA-directed RNA polymerase specialized sigma24 family protein
LYYFRNLSIREIAAAKRLSFSKTNGIIYRARRKLRPALEWLVEENSL